MSKWYAFAIDTFMSGWGPCGARVNVYCLECDSRDEADRVAAKLRARPEMRGVKVSQTPPKDSRGVLVSRADRTIAEFYYSTDEAK